MLYLLVEGLMLETDTYSQNIVMHFEFQMIIQSIMLYTQNEAMNRKISCSCV